MNQTIARVATAVALALCLSCSRAPRVVIDMYDGFEFAAERLVPTKATTFVIALIERDESKKVLYEFAILDHQVGPLPLTVREISGIRTSVQGEAQLRSPFQGATFTVAKAIPGSAFEVEFELGSDRVACRGVANSVSSTRPEVWPYDTRPPKRSLWQRLGLGA